MVIAIMGVAGAGKTTIGRQLARDLQWRFVDCDDLHSSDNIERLNHNIPLTDADREPWLQRIRSAIDEWLNGDEDVVLACSLLKATYRETVFAGHRDNVRLVYLKGDEDLLRQRLSQRAGHFVGEALLSSQLAILEEPADALPLEVNQPPATIIERIRAAYAI